MRREKEASEFRKLTQSFSDQINVIASIAKQSLTAVTNGIASSVNLLAMALNDGLTSVRDSSGFALRMTGEGIARTNEAISSQVKTATSTVFSGLAVTGDAIGNGFQAIGTTLNNAYQQTAKSVPAVIGNTMLAIKGGWDNTTQAISSTNHLAINTLDQTQVSLNKKVKEVSRDTGSSFNSAISNISTFASNTISGTTTTIASANKAVSDYLVTTEENISKQIAKTHHEASDTMKDKYQRITKGTSLAFRSFQKPVNNTADFLERTKVWFLTFESVVIDPNPTTISGVTIEELGKDYAVVSWKTNHYAWGKVNYGSDLTYGKEVLLMKREKVHTARLTGLKPGERYYFEVMSQNKNYAYDAYYSFETKK